MSKALLTDSGRHGLRERRPSILLIGHWSTTVSGSSLSFKQLVDTLAGDCRVDIKVVSTARPAHLTSSRLANIAVAVKVTASVLLRLRKVDVVTFHASLPAMMSYGPMLYVLTRLVRKPLLLRLFGGALEREYQGLSRARKWLFDRTLSRAELFLLQTRHLVEFLQRQGAKNIHWYPTFRHGVEPRAIRAEKCRRFVFMGRVIEEKGIGVILEAAREWAAQISVDIYGSLDGNYTAEQIALSSGGRARYKGVLTFEQAQEVLFDYDALILPTFYDGEGYPGVVLEAYGHGLPVIATQWRSIPEIVDETCGMLIRPRCAADLAQAMNVLHADTERYARLRRGALAKREEFSAQRWTDRFVTWCAELAFR